MICMYDHALAAVLRRRGHTDVATRIINPLASKPARMCALAEGMTALDDERTTALFLILLHDAIDADAWGAVDTAMLGIPALNALTELLSDEDECVRYLAAETLAVRGAPMHELYALATDADERIAVAAAWGLAVRGDTTCAVLRLRTHGRELVPRLLVLGAAGLRALCNADPRILHEGGLDEIATTIAERQRHRKVLIELAAAGSALATLALDRMPAETIEEQIAAALCGESDNQSSPDESGPIRTNGNDRT